MSAVRKIMYLVMHYFELLFVLEHGNHKRECGMLITVSLACLRARTLFRNVRRPTRACFDLFSPMGMCCRQQGYAMSPNRHCCWMCYARSWASVFRIWACSAKMCLQLMTMEMDKEYDETREDVRELERNKAS